MKNEPIDENDLLNKGLDLFNDDVITYALATERNDGNIN